MDVSERAQASSLTLPGFAGQFSCARCAIPEIIPAIPDLFYSVIDRRGALSLNDHHY